ncbi:MAG TPA: ribosome biogenesis GTPase Der, partial [Myxococcales bacterium]
MKPMVAIIGRPNVGKSTLFNRLTGRKTALVQDVPGVTRDRHYGNVEWNGREFIAIDTGGFLSGEADPLLAQVSAQAEAAIAASDAVVLVVDAQAGLTAPDQELAGRLRKQGKPVVLAVNKVDTEAQVPSASELYRLGFSRTALVSAEQLRGLDLLLDQIVSTLPAETPGELEPSTEEEEEEEGIRIAIVGRPNVGKSSLVNALLGEKRVVASEVPGTTRDPVDTPLTYRDRRFVLTDTAGIRRRSSMEERVEQLAVLFAFRAIESSEIVA